MSNSHSFRPAPLPSTPKNAAAAQNLQKSALNVTLPRRIRVVALRRLCRAQALRPARPRLAGKARQAVKNESYVVAIEGNLIELDGLSEARELPSVAANPPRQFGQRRRDIERKDPTTNRTEIQQLTEQKIDN